MRRLCSVLLFSFLLVSGVPSHAQTVDTAIVGTVTDNTGSVIPSATVTITDPATGRVKNVITSSIGEYSITYLRPGNYSVKVSANGFSTYEQKSIVLQINQQTKVNVVLQVGGAEQTVEVQASQPLLQSEDSSLGRCH